MDVAALWIAPLLAALLQAPATTATVEVNATADGLRMPRGARLLFTIDGNGRSSSALDHLGSGIDALADVDGDGTPDVLVGSSNGVPGLVQRRGFAEVRSGKTGAVIARVDGQDRPTNVAFGGDGFGLRLGRLDDVDGDGVNDFYVGGEPGLEAPYVNVYASARGAVTLLRTFTTGVDELAPVLAAGDRPGVRFWDVFAIRRCGDFDGDRRSELALACDGSTRVVSTAGWKPIAAFDGEFLGRSADLDADRKRDLFVLLTRHAPNGEPILGIRSFATGALLRSINSPAGNLDSFTWSGRGDADGDGHDDWAGTFDEEKNRSTSWPVRDGRFRVRTISGADLGVLHEWTEDVSRTGAIHGLRFVGDVDGDGGDDLAIARATDMGELSIHSGRTGERLLRFDAPGSTFGRTVARLGDLDGDGRADLAIGEPEHDRCAGRVWVVSLGGR